MNRVGWLGLFYTMLYALFEKKKKLTFGPVISVIFKRMAGSVTLLRLVATMLPDCFESIKNIQPELNYNPQKHMYKNTSQITVSLTM